MNHLQIFRMASTSLRVSIKHLDAGFFRVMTHLYNTDEAFYANLYANNERLIRIERTLDNNANPTKVMMEKYNRKAYLQIFDGMLNNMTDYQHLLGDILEHSKRMHAVLLIDAIPDDNNKVEIYGYTAWRDRVFQDKWLTTKKQVLMYDPVHYLVYQHNDDIRLYLLMAAAVHDVFKRKYKKQGRYDNIISIVQLNEDSIEAPQYYKVNRVYEFTLAAQITDMERQIKRYTLNYTNEHTPKTLAKFLKHNQKL
jgi:hypothetical protein